jgi:hypothetical protein
VKQSKKKKKKAKVHPADEIKKKLKKEHYAGGQGLQFLLESTEWSY